jgi:hypothetical protein
MLFFIVAEKIYPRFYSEQFPIRLPFFSFCVFDDVLSEWLRSATRNRMGLSRAGSNPADVEFLSEETNHGVLN